MQRQPIERVLDVGVKAINAMLTVGCGQRLGLIAGSGVGKSVLLGMLTKFTSADVVVIGLIGERGREVKEFIEQILGEEGMGHAVVLQRQRIIHPCCVFAPPIWRIYTLSIFERKGRTCCCW